MVKVAPSILAADMNDLEAEVKRIVEAGGDYIHIDVMDGKFVNNITPGLKMLKEARKATNITLDVHLMVENPKEYMMDFLEEADIITFHVEATKEEGIEEIIALLKGKGKKVGISIKPKTPVKAIEKYLKKVDMVLIMTVEPGFGGQKLILETVEKIKEIKELEPNLDIEVDGGINVETAQLVKKAGANILVAGTAVFGCEDAREVINELKK